MINPLYPLALTICADFFGNTNVGSNYGWVFTAYGIAGIVCLLGALTMALISRPMRPDAAVGPSR